MNDVWFAETISHLHVIRFPLVFVSCVNTGMNAVAIANRFRWIFVESCWICNRTRHSTITDYGFRLFLKVNQFSADLEIICK
jgi:hypothetical protein